MSIERGHASGVSSSAAPRPAAGKGAAAQAAAAGGDFLAMLAALADGLQGGDTLALGAGDAALADTGADRRSARRADEAALAASADGAAGFAGAGADAMAALLAAGAATGATVGAGVGAAVGAGGAVAGVVAGAEAVAKAAAAVAAAMAQGDAAPGRAATAGGLPGRADALAAPPEPPPPGPSAEAALATASAPSSPSGAAAAVATAAALDAAARHAGGGLPAEADPAYASVFEQLKSRLAAQDAAGTSTPAASRAQAATQELHQSERMLSQRSMAQALAAEPAAVQAGALDMPSGATASARGARGSLEAGAAGRTEGGWAPPEFTPTVQYDAGLVGGAAAASAATAATGDGGPLAEQLRYWLSQGVSSAEWTVAGDADPVQVSISLQGNEASVTFRSEQAGTRELLAATVDQLRDLLRQDGVVLSGVSVGAHGSGGQGQQPSRDSGPRAPTPGRQAAAAAPLAAPVSSPAGRTAAGGVDLFV